MQLTLDMSTGVKLGLHNIRHLLEEGAERNKKLWAASDTERNNYLNYSVKL